MPNSNVPVTSGFGTNIDTFTAPNGDHRQVVVVSDHGGYSGRASTFRTPGRGSTSQNIFSIHNATGSTVAVDVSRVTVDHIRTAVSATLTDFAVIRLWKVTVLPTNGTVLTKIDMDSGNGILSSSNVTVRGDASADGTLSGTTLTATLPAGTFITQEYAPRLFTAVGFEPMDRAEFLSAGPITLRALEGLVVNVSGTTGGNPNTAFYTVSCHWEEYTP